MSTPKATSDDLLDEGFMPMQFGKSSDAEFKTYLDKVLVSAGLWVEAKCGASLYAAMPGGSYAEDCARKAEVAYASAELFRRRYTFVEANASSALAKDQAMVLAELRKKAADAVQDASYWLGEALRAIGVDDTGLYAGTGLSSGVVETGRYPLTSTVVA